MRRYKTSLLLVLIFLASCTITRALWDSSYDESFNHFLVSEDGRYVVFIGQNYHYVFDDKSGVIKELLTYHKRNIVYIDVEKTLISVDHDNNISGYATIGSLMENILIKQDEIMLRALGFRGGERNPLSLTIRLHGKRYEPKIELEPSLPKLDRVYIVKIQESPGFFGSIAKAAITPITITADSVVVIGKVLLFPFSSS